MRKRILLVASELDQRAKIARALHSSGFAVELAGDEKRALKLAADYKFPLAIVASQSFRPPNLAMMRDLTQHGAGNHCAHARSRRGRSTIQ
jgi:DNA-binding response OmpR family regulator